MKKTTCTRIAFAIPLLTSTISLAAESPVRRPAQPNISPVGPAVRGRGSANKPFTAWNEAELVFTGKLLKD